MNLLKFPGKYIEQSYVKVLCNKDINNNKKNPQQHKPIFYPGILMAKYMKIFIDMIRWKKYFYL